MENAYTHDVKPFQVLPESNLEIKLDLRVKESNRIDALACISLSQV